MFSYILTVRVQFTPLTRVSHCNKAYMDKIQDQKKLLSSNKVPNGKKKKKKKKIIFDTDEIRTRARRTYELGCFLAGPRLNPPNAALAAAIRTRPTISVALMTRTCITMNAVTSRARSWRHRVQADSAKAISPRVTTVRREPRRGRSRRPSRRRRPCRRCCRPGRSPS